MIVSHTHEFIFIANPKVASQSIRQALQPFLTPGIDWEQCDLYESKRLPIPHLARLRTGHLTIAQLQPFISPEQFSRYLKFGFLREPVDRFVSACFFLRRDLVLAEDSDKAMIELLANKQWMNRIHLRPQVSFFSIDGRLSLDFIGRYESISEDLQTLSEACLERGIPVLPQLNTGQRKPSGYVAGPALREAVCRHYHEDWLLHRKLSETGPQQGI